MDAKIVTLLVLIITASTSAFSDNPGNQLSEFPEESAGERFLFIRPCMVRPGSIRCPTPLQGGCRRLVAPWSRCIRGYCCLR